MYIMILHLWMSLDDVFICLTIKSSLEGALRNHDDKLVTKNI